MTARTPDRIDHIVDGAMIAGCILMAAGATGAVGITSQSYTFTILFGMVLAVIVAGIAHAILTTSSDSEEPGAVE